VIENYFVMDGLLFIHPWMEPIINDERVAAEATLNQARWMAGMYMLHHEILISSIKRQILPYYHLHITYLGDIACTCMSEVSAAACMLSAFRPLFSKCTSPMPNTWHKN
jgi:hypothetical protein